MCSPHSASDRKWWTISVLTHVENTIKTEILMLCFRTQVSVISDESRKCFTYLTEDIVDFSPSHDCVGCIQKKENLAKTQCINRERKQRKWISLLFSVLSTGLSLNALRYVYLLNILNKNKTKHSFFWGGGNKGCNDANYNNICCIWKYN
jgi:hypothetical protein